MTNPFEHSSYLVRRKFLQLFGSSFHIYDPQGQLVFYSRQKAFKLREDIRLYTGEDMATEVLLIKARQIVDLAAAYDVYDSGTGEKVGALRRKGLKSLFRDEWRFLDPDDQEIGVIREDGLALALIRRLLTNLIPQSFHAEIGGRPVCSFRQKFNPFVYKLTVDFTADPGHLLNRRLGIAAALLLAAIEGRQG